MSPKKKNQKNGMVLGVIISMALAVVVAFNYMPSATSKAHDEVTTIYKEIMYYENNIKKKSNDIQSEIEKSNYEFSESEKFFLSILKDELILIIETIKNPITTRNSHVKIIYIPSIFVNNSLIYH